MVEHLYMGRSPPMFTEMRVLRQSTGDDHLVCNLFLLLVDSCIYVLFVVIICFLAKGILNLLYSGFRVGNEFSDCRRYECNTCSEAIKENGFWDEDKVTFDGHACWREGKNTILYFQSLLNLNINELSRWRLQKYLLWKLEVCQIQNTVPYLPVAT